jgi:negative modulator of initiation of replication
MKTVLIDDDLYSYLVGHTQEIGESASSILRRLLGLQRGHYGNEASQEEVLKTFDFLRDWDQYCHLTLTKKFLHILAWAYQQHEKEFEKACTIEGAKRKYFATDAKVLLDSGRSTNPRPIPDSPYWVVTNNSTAKKAEILSDLLRLLGYKPESIHALLRYFGG